MFSPHSYTNYNTSGLHQTHNLFLIKIISTRLLSLSSHGYLHGGSASEAKLPVVFCQRIVQKKFPCRVSRNAEGRVDFGAGSRVQDEMSPPIQVVACSQAAPNEVLVRIIPAKRGQRTHRRTVHTYAEFCVWCIAAAGCTSSCCAEVTAATAAWEHGGYVHVAPQHAKRGLRAVLQQQHAQHWHVCNTWCNNMIMAWCESSAAAGATAAVAKLGALLTACAAAAKIAVAQAARERMGYYMSERFYV